MYSKSNSSRKSRCKREKAIANKWLFNKQTSLIPMCDQFRTAYFNDDQHSLQQLEELFGQGRCLCCGYTLLHLAISTESKKLVEYYLSRNANVKKRTDNGDTALHLACTLNDNWFVQQLLMHKANANATDELGCTPLQICLSQDAPSTTMLKLLLNHGARPNKFFYLEEDIEESIAKMIKANTRNSSGVLPLYEAIYMGDYFTAQRLLEDGACPDCLKFYRQTLLQIACHGNHVECATALVKAGANVNESDMEGRTALHYAVISESAQIVKLLLSHNCNLWIRDSGGYTAFGIAALTNRWQVVEALFEGGARCTDMLLMESLERQCTDVVLSMLRQGYFQVHGTKFGRSLLYCAISTEQQQVVDYLLSIGVEVGYEGSEDEDDFSLSASNPSWSIEMEASFVSREVVVERPTNVGVKKALHSQSTQQPPKKQSYVPRLRYNTSSSVIRCKQVKHSEGVVNAGLQSELQVCQQDRIAQNEKATAPLLKSRRRIEQRSSTKCVVSHCTPITSLANNKKKHTISSAKIQSKSASVSPKVQILRKSQHDKSCKPQTIRNTSSFFNFRCRRELDSNLTIYENQYSKTVRKNKNGIISSTKVDTFFQFYKYCVL